MIDRKTRRLLAWLLFGALLACVLCAKAETYYVSTEGGTLNARIQPGGAVEYELENGAPLEVASLADGWAEISYCGDTLYVSAHYLCREDKPAGEYTVIGNGRVWVRKAPSPQSKRAGKLYPGDTITVTHWATGDDGSCWACTEAGYVCGDYLQAVEKGAEP